MFLNLCHIYRIFLDNDQDFCFPSSRTAPLILENGTVILNGSFCELHFSNFAKFSREAFSPTWMLPVWNVSLIKLEDCNRLPVPHLLPTVKEVVSDAKEVEALHSHIRAPLCQLQKYMRLMFSY